MGQKVLIVESNRQLQRELDEQIRTVYPGVEPLVYVRKAFDVPQITTIAIGGAQLAVAIVALAFQIRDRQPKEEKSKITIEIQDGERKLRIDAAEHQADINKIVEDFLKG